MPRWHATRGVRVVPISIGPKLSTGSWPASRCAGRCWCARLRDALRAQAPYDVLMVHYKKEQLLGADPAAGAASHGRLGGVGAGAVPAAAGPARAAAT